jgi:hypothetical protein
MATDLIEDVVRTAYRALSGKGPPGPARALMQDPAAPATALFVAATRLLGPAFRTFEPETIWLELDAPQENRDKLSAAIALAVMPAFFWDVRVFGTTVLALNDLPVFPSEMPAPLPEQMAWGAIEAELIFALADDEGTEPNYGDEVTAYVAALLLHAGLVVCPEPLEFAADDLQRLLPGEGRDTAAKVLALPPTISERGTLPPEESSPFYVQRWRLAEVHRYVHGRLESLKKAVCF